MPSEWKSYWMKKEPGLFDDSEGTIWGEEWKNMPEFVQEDLSPWKTLLVHFENEADLLAFSKLIDQNLNTKTQGVWYPEAEIGRYANFKRYSNES
jgi:hypothetical protein